MRKIKLIKIEPRNAFLNSWSDSEPYKGGCFWITK